MEKITYKLFAGFLLSPELKVQLGRSKKWKEDAFLPFKENVLLIKVHYQGKDYIGQYFLPHISMNDLKDKDVSMRQLLQEYCPRYDCVAIHFCIFPQTFVS